MSEAGYCMGCHRRKSRVVEGLCDGCTPLFGPVVARARTPPMPTPPNDPRHLAEAAIAAMTALVAADVSTAEALAPAIGAIRAKYPAVAVGPSNPIDPG